MNLEDFSALFFENERFDVNNWKGKTYEGKKD